MMKKLALKLKVLLLAVVSAALMFAFVGCERGEIATYTVTYDTLGGTEIESVELKAGDTIPVPQEPEKDMFTFTGWYVAPGSSEKFTLFGEGMPENDITVYAGWSPVRSVKVTYVANGGTETEPSIGKVGTAFIQPDEPTRTGYTFGGWFTDPDCTEEYEFATFPQEPLTLYAKWQNNSGYVYVTYYGNGELVDRVAVLRGTKLKEPKLFGDAKDFGWYTDAAMQNAYTFGAELNANLTLYASYYTDGLSFGFDSLKNIHYVESYSGSERKVIVPDTYNGSPIKKIGERAFRDSDITSVVLPATVTEICREAFYNCRYLASINISKNVTAIGAYAFFNNERLTSCGDISSVTVISDGLFLGCKKLSGITLDPAVTAIGEAAFADCLRLTTMTIPAKVHVVGDYLFSGCTALKEVTLPAALVTLGDGVFYGCTALSSINIPATNENYKVVDGNLFHGTELIRYVRGDKTEKAFTVRANVTYVAEKAFEGCGDIESLRVAGASTELACGALYGMRSLKELTVPSFMGEDGESGYLSYLFGATDKQTSGTQNYVVPETLISVTVTSPDVSVITDYAFFGVQSLESITWNSSITEIGQYAFAYTTIESYEFSGAMEKIAYSAFIGCEKLATVTVSGSSDTFAVYENCLYDKELTELRLVPACATEIKFPNTLTKIGDYAAIGCKIKSIVVPETVTAIGFGAFMDCDELTEMTLPFIGNGSDKAYLAYIFGSSISYKTEDGSYTSVEAANSVRIPIALKKVKINTTVTSIPDFSFAFISSLEEVEIGGDITEYGAFAFYGTGITSVDLTGVTKIGEYAFAFTELTEIVVPATATDLGNGCFAYNRYVTAITIEEGITAIPDAMFYSYNDEYPDSSLNTVITIPASVESIGVRAFVGAGVHYLDETNYELNEGFGIEFAAGSRLESIGKYAFYAAGMTELSLPSTVKTIGDFAFYWCDFMKEITIGDKDNGSEATYIGMWAFGYCKALKTVTLYAETAPALPKLVPDTTDQLNYSGTGAFYGSGMATIYVPADSVDAYKTAEGWSYYSQYIKAIEEDEE